MALLPPVWLDAVVAIGAEREAGTVAWIGTGFLYGAYIKASPPPEKWYHVFLITSRHVLEGEQKLQIKFNSAVRSGSQDFSVPLRDRSGRRLWTVHSDSAVDLAAVFIDGNYIRSKNMRFAFFKDDEDALTVGGLKSEGVTEGDGVFVLGYPMALVQPKWQAAICRKGCVARIQDVLVAGTGEFLVDATVFPGNSGSPVILRPEATAIPGTKTASAARVIGVVCAYLPYQDVAVSQQTQMPRITFDENSGLTSVIPMDRVNELMTTARRHLKARIAVARWRARRHVSSRSARTRS